mmetsp:Transcript_5657/g.12310  ORF Transcript_5657/g.12310 Transcript_5657/m.12310 type:complete len:302 (+) Transcript_5657:250-1155(+)
MTTAATEPSSPSSCCLRQSRFCARCCRLCAHQKGERRSHRLAATACTSLASLPSATAAITLAAPSATTASTRARSASLRRKASAASARVAETGTPAAQPCTPSQCWSTLCRSRCREASAIAWASSFRRRKLEPTSPASCQTACPLSTTSATKACFCSEKAISASRPLWSPFSTNRANVLHLATQMLCCRPRPSLPPPCRRKRRRSQRTPAALASRSKPFAMRARACSSRLTRVHSTRRFGPSCRAPTGSPTASCGTCPLTASSSRGQTSFSCEASLPPCYVAQTRGSPPQPNTTPSRSRST